jgi:hypothetical protein
MDINTLTVTKEIFRYPTVILTEIVYGTQRIYRRISILLIIRYHKFVHV